MAKPAVSAPSKERVLLIDAAIDEREMYAIALRRSGYEVAESTDGEEGLVEAGRWLPSVIVTDVVLPKLDGLQLIEELRQQPATRDVPVIVLTGCDHATGIIAEALAAGAACVRIKPCLPEMLLREVRRVLDISKALRTRSAEARVRAEQARGRAIAALSQASQVTTRPCPTCGAELQPAASARAHGDRHYYVHYRPCRNGCGSWYYDEVARRLIKLM
jgi:DNA-binding response OmpR family regulator